MKKINWGFLPATIFCLVMTFPVLGEPKDFANLYGYNWIMGVVTLIWIILMFLPALTNNK